LDQLIEKNGTDFEYILLKGDVLFLKEDYKNAMELYKTILNIDSELEKALINEKLGDAYAMLNNITEALNYWRKARELGANSETLQKKITNEAYFE
jgi:lipopolysaccharide biosynthesis regulator YciM